MLDLIFFHEISFPFMGSLLKVKTLNALKGLISEIGKAGPTLIAVMALLVALSAIWVFGGKI